MKETKVKRIHNTKEKYLILRNSAQQSFIDKFKPKGLWYGIDGDWLEWCKSSMPHWIYPYNYELKIELSKMVVISNREQLIQFHNRYKSEYGIDWKAVAKAFFGIEINPYLWNCRFLHDVHWYYGWDCASGCIWNKDAILNYSMVAELIIK